MPTSLPQMPAPASPWSHPHGSGIAWTQLQWETASYSVLLPTREHGTIFFQPAAAKGSGEKNRPGGEEGRCECGAPSRRRKSVHNVGRRASLGRTCSSPGRQTLARSSSVSWGDKTGSGIPGHSGQRHLRDPPSSFSCENTMTQKSRPRATPWERPVCHNRSHQVPV